MRTPRVTSVQFHLRYRIGSVLHHEEFGSDLAAIGRAIALMDGAGAHDFSIHDERGFLLKSQADIVAARKQSR